LNCYKNEFKLAVYLEFTDKETFQQFWFSYLVLKLFSVFKNIRVESVYKDTVNAILERINSTILTDLTLNEITQKAVIINHKSKTRRIEETQILTKLLLYMYELMQTIDLILNAVKGRQTTVIKWLEHL